MKYLIAAIVFAAVLLFTSCQGPHLDGGCVHPLVMGGMPFAIPAGSHFTTYGALRIPNPNGGMLTLTGAACVIGGGK